MSSNPRVTSLNPGVTSSNPRVTSSISRVTSSDPRIINSMKTQVNRLKSSSFPKITSPIRQFHCVQSVRIRSYSGPHFPAFRLNTERCGVYDVR